MIGSQSWQSNLLWTRLSRSAPPRARRCSIASINGKKPADLPVRARPGTELFINLKTAAKVLDLTEPNALWVSANEVIE